MTKKFISNGTHYSDAFSQKADTVTVIIIVLRVLQPALRVVFAVAILARFKSSQLSHIPFS